MRMTEPVSLLIGADLYGLINKVVTLDIEFAKDSQERKLSALRHPDRLLVTGVLTAAKDSYKNDELDCTYLVIGDTPVTLTWGEVHGATVCHLSEED